ncbi:MAG: hypothetical protein IJV85_00820 [Clostridia bacterium]|nr:hypothetical protein [Clostridia bacterium]
MRTLFERTRAYGLLKREKEENKLFHAYLLLLDDSRNLRFALKTFAKVLFSCEGENTPEKERLASRIESESFSDCLFYPEVGKKFSVDDAERIAEESSIRPVEGERKVFVVGNFAEATPQAQNKLLKLLEEPPEGVVFLLGATTAFPILSTVLSRVSKLEIPPFEQGEIAHCLSRTYGNKYTPSELSLAAATCGGSLGLAQNLLEGGRFQGLADDAFALATATLATLPALVKKIGETKDKKPLLSFLRIVFRDALVLKTGLKKENLLLKSEEKRLARVANKYTLSALVYAQECLTEAEKQVYFNAVFGQCIELCLVKILKRNQEE